MPRTWWQVLSGPSAISRWTFIVVIPILAIHIQWNASIYPGGWPAHALMEIAGVLPSVVFLAVAGATWLAPGRADTPHRAPLALATFVAAGLIRAGVLIGIRERLGPDIDWNHTANLAAGTLLVVLTLWITAYIVDSVRRHLVVRARLLAELSTITRAERLEEDEISAIQRDYSDHVIRRVTSAVRDLQGSSDRAEVAETIRHLNEAVVRPGSHALFAGDALTEQLHEPDPRVRIRDVVTGLRVAAPIAGPVLYEAALIGGVAGALGWRWALVNAVTAGAVLALGNLALRWLLGRGTRVAWWLVPLGYALVTSLGVFASALALTLAGLPQGQLLGGALLYWFTMVVISLAASIGDQQRTLEEELAATVHARTDILASLRTRGAEQRRHLAHLMHGSVQAEMTAAALTITAAIDNGASAREVDALLDALVRSISAASDDETPDVSPEVELQEILQAWGAALHIGIDISPAAQRALARDRDLGRRVIDVASEGLTNAVRHAAATQVSLTVAVDGDDLLLHLSHEGTLDRHSTGLGLQGIADISPAWSLEQQGPDVVLMVRLPAETTGPPASASGPDR